jgi:hypothetical protein
MKLDRITGHTDGYGGGLSAFCPACWVQNGSPRDEQPLESDKPPENIRLYVCRACRHPFEVEVPSSGMAEVARVVSQGTVTITAPCPWCGNPEEHKVETCVVECRECHAQYRFRPQTE